MGNRRYEGSSVVDEDDNLWVIGGTHDSKGSGILAILIRLIRDHPQIT